MSTKEVDNPVDAVHRLCVLSSDSRWRTSGFPVWALGKYALPIQLAIGCVQAGLVAYFFMHLRQGDRVVILTALSSLFWMGILFVLFMADYMTRHQGGQLRRAQQRVTG